MPSLKFRTLGFPQYGFKDRSYRYGLLLTGPPLSPTLHTGFPFSIYLTLSFKHKPMIVYTTTLFLPSPAVPYVRFSLLIVTRWKPLPPRHYCDTQAHHYTLVAPVPRGPLLRGVMLSTSIIANTASSASLMDSFRLHLVQAYTESLCHSRIDPDCTSDLPQFTL